MCAGVWWGKPKGKNYLEELDKKKILWMAPTEETDIPEQNEA
jgi:hypothetical protein